MNKFMEKQVVSLINDPDKHRYIVTNVLGHSTGPVGQFPKSRVYRVKDQRGKIWEFREDSLEPHEDKDRVVKSALQDWVMELPLREQGTLMTAVRGCDFEAKSWTSTGVSYSAGRRLTAFIRWCFMNPADIREVDSEEGAFMMSTAPPNFKPSEFGHLPQHWYSHVMHALEVIGYRHPDIRRANDALWLYTKMVHNMHLNVETKEQMIERLSEDRIKSGKVVS